MGEYDDIIDLPHPVSETRPQMSMHQRAAQFKPFAALTGFEEKLAAVEREANERQCYEVWDPDDPGPYLAEEP